MEKTMTKNVQRCQSQKDNGGEPKINTDKDNAACQEGVKVKTFLFI
jgi:hypothetical protein